MVIIKERMRKSVSLAIQIALSVPVSELVIRVMKDFTLIAMVYVPHVAIIVNIVLMTIYV